MTNTNIEIIYNCFYVNHFKSSNEIKETLIYLEETYLKDKKFLFFKFSHIKKRNVILDLRRNLSVKILSFISNNFISDSDLLFIKLFYSKYFLLSNKEMNPKHSFLDLLTGYSPSFCHANDFNLHNHGDLSPQLEDYFNYFYHYLFLIIIFDEQLLLKNFLNYFPINSNFYYHFIDRYICYIHYDTLYNIKFSNFLSIILLNLKDEKSKNFYFFRREEALNIFLDLIKNAQERQNLKNNLENF